MRVALTGMVFVAIIGISITAYIVRTEGFDGLWARKKSFLRQMSPETSPIVDRAERAVRERNR